MFTQFLFPENLVEFQKGLLDWFAESKRDFPWRETNNPYHIIIAEKLLQQTIARDQVVEAYNEILRQYPSPIELANSDIQELTKIIEPLGLIYRANELNIMAMELVQEHDSEVPQQLNELLNLTGIGQYCARAVLSFAFRQNVAIVDTNVARFLFRLFGILEPMPANPARKKTIINLAQSIMPMGKSRDFNLAILDLCALVCKSRKPLCESCPVSKFCMYYHNIKNDRQ